MTNEAFPLVSAIVAMDEHNGIGKDNRLLWKMPADLLHFKRITTGHPIIMGRKTYASIGKPLPHRTNIIVTRNPNLLAPGCIVTRSVEDALLCATYSCSSQGSLQSPPAKPQAEIFIIGGTQIFTESFPFLQYLYITLIHHRFDADTFFPPFNAKEWKEISKEEHAADEKNPYAYTFLELEKKF